MSAETALAKKDPMETALAPFDASKYNLCAPVTAIDRVPDMYRISVRVVTVNPETETYPIPGENRDNPDHKVGLAKVALDKIASAGNIQWLPGQCGQIDDWKDPYRVKYRAVGLMKNFDGESRIISAEKVIDLRGKPGDPEDQMGADTQEIIRVAKKKNRDPWPQIAQARGQIHSLGESKSKNRAIRSGLAIPVAIPKSQVKKPFVIPALVLQPDMSDPEVKKAAIAHMFGTTAALYGPTPVSVHREPEVIDVEPEPIQDPRLAPGETVNGDGVIHEAEVVTADQGLSAQTFVEMIDGPEPWDEPQQPPVEVARRRYMMNADEIAGLPSERRSWFVRLGAITQEAYDKFGTDEAAEKLSRIFPVEWPGNAATIPAADVAKIATALKNLLAGR